MKRTNSLHCCETERDPHHMFVPSQAAHLLTVEKVAVLFIYFLFVASFTDIRECMSKKTANVDYEN